MASPRIYTTQLLSEGQTLTLDNASSRHVAGALRMSSGQSLTLFNGRGGEYPCTITAVGKREVEVEVGPHCVVERESSLQVHLGIVMSRGDRMDWVVQKSTELGVTDITPLISERCEVKLAAERREKKLRHWQGIVNSACEQCGRNTLATVHPVTPLQDWLHSIDCDLGLVLHHRAAAPLPEQPPGQHIAVLIGPEGGLTAPEIDSALEQHFQALRLGPRILRTETAPLAALAVLQQQWGDLSE